MRDKMMRVYMVPVFLLGGFALAADCGSEDAKSEGGGGSAAQNEASTDYHAECDRAYSAPECSYTPADCKAFLDDEFTAFTGADCWDEMTPWLECIVGNQTMNCLHGSLIDPEHKCDSLSASGVRNCCGADPKSFLCNPLGCVNCGEEDWCYCCTFNDNANSCWAKEEDAEKNCASPYYSCAYHGD